MTTVETSYGRLRGSQAEGVCVFKGIPFAKPPVGDLRWRAPQRLAPWPGVRDALQFGPCAIQSTMPGDVGELIGIATHGTSEDCLYLNIWTPATDAAKRPVMVWIHGGGNTVGAGSQPRVNGEHLARIGDVVVVTINYRLGALGFLHAPELGASGNEALLDQAAALRWVRDEIGAFGGDADNVTLFGQSAGGFDIVQLMAMPTAGAATRSHDGLFHKAVPMSGSLTQPLAAEAAHAQAVALASKFGGFDKLREVPAEAILAEQGEIGRWAPTQDGEVIVEDTADVLKSGRFTRGMPLLIGHTRDESTLFTMFDKRLANMDKAHLVELARDQFGDYAEDAVHCYEGARAANGLARQPAAIWAAMATDRMFRMPAIQTAMCHFAHTQEIWMYRFDHESPAHDGRLGACHSLDIPFVWGTYQLPEMQRFCGTGDAVARLSERVMASWLAFAYHGDPNNDALPHWPRYGDGRATMLFDDKPWMCFDPLSTVREFLRQWYKF